MTSADAWTLAIAVLGAVLGVVNTIYALDRDRVKLRIVSKIATPVGPMGLGPDHVCSEVVNLSTFPLTINEVGFKLSGTTRRLAITDPILVDGGPWPRRLEPRSSVTVYAPAGIEHQPAFGHVADVYATTDCGETHTGSARAARGWPRRPSAIRHISALPARARL